MAPRSHLHRLAPAIWLPARCTAFMVPALLLAMPECQALDVVLGGEINPASEFNSNLFLTTRPHEDTWGEGVDGTIDLSLADSRWKTQATGRFQNRWYPNDNNLDYYNQLFSVKSQYFSERAVWGLDSQYNMDNTLSSLDSLDLGFVFTRIPRTTRLVSPNVTYSLTENTSLALAYTYQDTTYDQQKSSRSVVDSEAHTGSLNLTHQWNERLQLLGSMSYTSYDLLGIDQSFDGFFPLNTIFGLLLFPSVTQVPGTTGTINTASLMGGFNFKLTETIDLAFSGGGQHNDTSNPETTITTSVFGTPVATRQIPATENSTISEVYSGRASKHFERSDLSLDISRSISPSLQGILYAYDRYSLSGTHKFTPHLSGSLNLSLSNQSGVGGDSALVDRDLYTIRAGVDWQWAQNWRLNASYQYSQVDYNAASGSPSTAVDSHALYFNIRYLFDKQQL